MGLPFAIEGEHPDGVQGLDATPPALFDGLTGRGLPLVVVSRVAGVEPRLTIAAAAARPEVLVATLISLGVGAVILVPSLAWLYVLFQRPPPPPPGRQSCAAAPPLSGRAWSEPTCS